jgi:hypothetical protein
VTGDHQGSLVRPSLYTMAAIRPAIPLGVAGAAAVAGAGLFLWSRRGTTGEESRADEVEAHPS